MFCRRLNKSVKKIKRLETECKKLEIQIGKDKNELEDLNKSLSDLKEHTSNYNDRIEILQKELKKSLEKKKLKMKYFFET